jgi:hypothetical protein
VEETRGNAAGTRGAGGWDGPGAAPTTAGSSTRRSLTVTEALKLLLLIAVSVALGELAAKAVWFWLILGQVP